MEGVLRNDRLLYLGQLKRYFRLFLFLSLVAIGAVVSFFRVGDWLVAADDDPVRVDLIVCLSGSQQRIEKAAELWRQGLADRIFVTSNKAYQLMLAQGVAVEKIIAPHWSARTTYQEVELVRELVDRDKWSMLVVSDPYHLFRVRWTFRHLFAEQHAELFFVSSDPVGPPNPWWTSRDSRLYVMTELPKIAYYWLWHGMLGISEEPDWASGVWRRYTYLLNRIL